MLKLVLGALAALAVIVVLAGAGWWVFIREDDKLATSPPDIPDNLGAQTQTARTATPNDGSLTFEVVAQESEAAYFVTEELARVGLPSTAKGATKTLSGTFHLTADGWQLDMSQPSTFTVDLRTLKSNEDARDSRVQGALETSTFPTATFTASRVSGVDTSLSPEIEQEFEVTGTLDLHGVQREVTWTVKARRLGNVMTLLATTTFLFADYNITPPNIAGVVTIGDDVTLQMQIIAQTT